MTNKVDPFAVDDDETPFLRAFFPEALYAGTVTMITCADGRALKSFGRFIIEQALGDPMMDLAPLIAVNYIEDRDSYFIKLAKGMARVNKSGEKLDKALERVRHSRITVIDAGMMSLDSVYQELLTVDRMVDIGVIVISNLADIFLDGMPENSFGWMRIGSRLKQISRKLEAPIIVLAQTTGEEYTPTRDYNGIYPYVDVQIRMSRPMPRYHAVQTVYGVHCVELSTPGEPPVGLIYNSNLDHFEEKFTPPNPDDPDSEMPF